MGGLITHLVAGLIISMIALLYYRKKIKSLGGISFLVLVALWFSIVPDAFTALYIVLGIPFGEIYHILWLLSHPVFFGVSLAALFFLKRYVDVPNEMLWVVAFSAVALHFVIDLTVNEPFWWL